MIYTLLTASKLERDFMRMGLELQGRRVRGLIDLLRLITITLKRFRRNEGFKLEKYVANNKKRLPQFSYY